MNSDTQHDTLLPWKDTALGGLARFNGDKPAPLNQSSPLEILRAVILLDETNLLDIYSFRELEKLLFTLKLTYIMDSSFSTPIEHDIKTYLNSIEQTTHDDDTLCRTRDLIVTYCLSTNCFTWCMIPDSMLLHIAYRIPKTLDILGNNIWNRVSNCITGSMIDKLEHDDQLLVLNNLIWTTHVINSYYIMDLVISNNLFNHSTPSYRTCNGSSESLIIACSNYGELKIKMINNWSIEECNTRVKNKNGWTVANGIISHSDEYIILSMLSKWSASDCNAEFINNQGHTSAMLIARRGTFKTHQLLINKWGVANCYTYKQSKSGWTLPMIIARYGNNKSRKLLLDKWSARDCHSELQTRSGYNVQMILARYGNDDIRQQLINTWPVDECYTSLSAGKEFDRSTLPTTIARYGNNETRKLLLDKWSARDCHSELQDNDGYTVQMLLAKYGNDTIRQQLVDTWTMAECHAELYSTDGMTIVKLLQPRINTPE